ncbi:hypothetical protein VH1807_contig00016-0005 [Vibrio harveyi]|nr:hypothetical protein VH1807_contig00016-0005 [Vibrio harveyi]
MSAVTTWGKKESDNNGLIFKNFGLVTTEVSLNEINKNTNDNDY